MQVKGNVVNTFSKTKNTRSGKMVTIHYAEIDDGTTINVGFKPMWEPGEYITVNVEEKYGELQIAKGGAPTTGSPTTSTTNPPKSGGTYVPKKFPLEATDQQVSIIRQSSLNRAVETTRDMVAAGIITPKNMEAYIETIMTLAYDYTDFGTGQREVKEAEERAVKKAALEAVNG